MFEFVEFSHLVYKWVWGPIRFTLESLLVLFINEIANVVVTSKILLNEDDLKHYKIDIEHMNAAG